MFAAYTLPIPAGVPTHETERIPELSYSEAVEFASFGGEIIQERAVALAQKYGTELDICSPETIVSGKGTRIRSRHLLADRLCESRILATRKNVFYVDLQVSNRSGQTQALVSALSERDVRISSLMQNFSEERSHLSFAAPQEDLASAHQTLDELEEAGVVLDYMVREDLFEASLICAGDVNPRKEFSKFTAAIARSGGEILAVYASGIRVSAIIASEAQDHSEFSQAVYQIIFKEEDSDDAEATN